MSRKPRKYTVKVDYPALQRAIDAHEVYRGNNTSFCIGMGFEKRTSWVSDIKRGRNFPSPEEAAKMCLLLQTTPEEILLHSGPTEEETQKCLEDIEEVKRLIEVERGRNIETAPADKSGSQSEEEFMMLFQQLSPEEQANEIAYLRERIAREAAKGK